MYEMKIAVENCPKNAHKNGGQENELTAIAINKSFSAIDCVPGRAAA